MTATLTQEATATIGVGAWRNCGQATAGSVSLPGCVKKMASIDSFKETTNTVAEATRIEGASNGMVICLIA